MRVRYNYPVHRARNVFTAVALAEKLKKSGDFDIFRGQIANWRLQPSAHRTAVSEASIVEQLSHFGGWIKQTPDLASLHDDVDSLYAVAQHYGLSTSLLDFTTDPQVAGFFASHGTRPAHLPLDLRSSCIICANSDWLTRSWADINQSHREQHGFDLVRIVMIDVRNLWRLQAQKGLFLRVHVDPTFLEMFSGFLHIEFPWSSNRVGSEADIYPENKSHLEVLLDQYFLIRSYPERRKQLEEIFGPPIYEGPQDYIGEPSYFVDDTFPPVHESWSDESLAEWLLEPEEVYTSFAPGVVTLRAGTHSSAMEDYRSLVGQLEEILTAENLRKNPRLVWKVITSSGSEPLFDERDKDSAPITVAEVVRIIFDGMRMKPYSDRNIAQAVALIITMSVYDGWTFMKGAFGDVLGIEFSGGYTRGRGFCDGKRILTALRDDFFGYVKPEKREEIRRQGGDGVLGILIDPRRLFVFERFRDLFAEEAIPTHACLMIEGKVFVLNAARVDVFGLA